MRRLSVRFNGYSLLQTMSQTHAEGSGSWCHRLASYLTADKKRTLLEIIESVIQYPKAVYGILGIITQFSLPSPKCT